MPDIMVDPKEIYKRVKIVGEAKPFIDEKELYFAMMKSAFRDSAEQLFKNIVSRTNLSIGETEIDEKSFEFEIEFVDDGLESETKFTFVCNNHRFLKSFTHWIRFPNYRPDDFKKQSQSQFSHNIWTGIIEQYSKELGYTIPDAINSVLSRKFHTTINLDDI